MIIITLLIPQNYKKYYYLPNFFHVINPLAELI